MRITIANMLHVEDMPLELADRVRRDVTAPNPEYVKRELSPGVCLQEWLPYQRRRVA